MNIESNMMCWANFPKPGTQWREEISRFERVTIYCNDKIMCEQWDQTDISFVQLVFSLEGLGSVKEMTSDKMNRESLSG